jgi:hypothetical protein
LVNISPVLDEEETTHDTLQTGPPITPVGIKFAFVIGRSDAIEELSTVDSGYILAGAKCTPGHPAAVDLPRFPSGPNTKGYHITLDCIPHPLNTLRYQPSLHHPTLVSGYVLDGM